MTTPALTVVMPCYNERDWVSRSVAALVDAAERAVWPVRIIVVDDGSTDPATVASLDAMAAAGTIDLIRQANAGRLAARSAGLDAVGTEMVLLLDSRVILHPDALVALRERLEQQPGSAWNAHVDVVTVGNPWAAFWGGLTKIGWRAYFARPRPVTFGPEEFDRFPKGTGAFACPVAVLQRAASRFESLYEDARFASDDTKLLRNVAADVRIGIDPGFRVDYHGRDSAPRWARQVFFRGTTFVDGYVQTPGRALALLVGLGLAVPAGVVALVRWPAPVSGLVVACSAGASAAANACGGTRDETVWTGVLLTPFTVIFGAGFVRGLALAVRAGRRRRA